MTIEDVYLALKVIKDKAKSMTEDSFDKTKAFKYVYNSVLDIIDDLNYLEEQDDLLDDDFDEIRETKIKQQNNDDEDNFNVFDEDDLI